MTTLQLYQNVKVNLLRNFTVDDIGDYLSTLSSSDKRTISNLNYFKHKLESKILLELGQEILDYGNNIPNWNYCSITNVGTGIEKTCYYFITNMEWRSKEVVELTLRMDSISTLGLRNLTNRTLIHRQHKDRFKRIGGDCFPLIDKASEGVSPVLYKQNDTIISQYMNMKWYLAYITENNPTPTDYTQVNPLQTYIIPQYTTKVRLPSNDQYYSTPSDYESGKYYIFSPYTMKTNKFEVFVDGSLVGWCKIEKKATYTSYTFLQINKTGSGLHYSLKEFKIDYQGNTSTEVKNLGDTTGSIALRLCPSIILTYKSDTPKQDPRLDYNFEIDASSSPTEIKGLQDFDLSDSKIVRVVELPYAPFDYIPATDGTLPVNHNAITIKANVDYRTDLLTGTTLLKLRFTEDSEFLVGNIYLGSPFYYSVDMFEYTQSDTFTKTNLYNASDMYWAETKLYSTEFYNAKVVYDSFSYLLDFNIIDFSSGFDWDNLVFKIKPSESLSRDFLFDFTDYITSIEGLEDYPTILPIKRNNEVGLYSSDYINYMRTGYNYDVKAKEIRQAFSYFDIAKGASMGAMAGGMAGGAWGAVAGAATSLITTIPSMIERSMLETNTLEKQLATLKQQKVSVSTEDDLSLMNYYTKGGLAHFIEYAPSNVMQENLLNLFHYSGYTCEYLGVPNLNSRLRFNYIKADIDLDMTKIAWRWGNIPQDVIEDYKDRFSIGLTIIHKFEGEYDFEQKYENWESILEDILQD